MLDICAKKLYPLLLRLTCELCNERGHFNFQCELFHDQIMSKNFDNLITLEHYNELSLFLGYEEMKHKTNEVPDWVLIKMIDFDLNEIYMYCTVNCIENPYIANYLKIRKQIEDEENTDEGEETSQYLPIFFL
jgi:hypothetical protein